MNTEHIQTEVPTRALTQPPGYHWFGYYDKWEFDPSDRYVLSNEVSFEGRSPGADDQIQVGMVDLQNNDEWIELGTTYAWNWQQGCMLQWLPGSQNEVIWNGRDENSFESYIFNIDTEEKRTVPHPIYTVSSDGKWGMTPDFERIQDMRPGYGYAGFPDPNGDVLAPENAGIYRVNLETGEADRVISIAEVAAIPFPNKDLSEAKHYFNHLLFAPSGHRFIFLHRWRFPDNEKYKNVGGFGTRMMTANYDGSDIRVIDDSGFTSHFIWKGPDSIMAWTQLPSHGPAFYMFPDGPGEARAVAPDIMTRNGHNTFIPGTNHEWILNDTYPDENRMIEVYLFHEPTHRKVTLGKFYLPEEYAGEWRVDTHPRSSRDGTMVVVDSPAAGNGRQLYLMDISNIIQ
jgi:hypothetical protein